MSKFMCAFERVIFDHDRSIVKVCDASIDLVYDNAILVYINNPRIARDLLGWLRKKHIVIHQLANTILLDSWMLRSSGAKMNMFIARLSKLLRILRQMCIWVHYDEHSMTCIRSYELYAMWRLERYVEVMKAVSDEVRRIRRAVHELIYPRLHDDLEKTKRIIVYADVTSGAPLVCDIRVDNDDGMSRLEMKCLVDVVAEKNGSRVEFGVRVDPFKLLEKIIERREKRKKREPSIPNVQILDTLLDTTR